MTDLEVVEVNVNVVDIKTKNNMKLTSKLARSCDWSC